MAGLAAAAGPGALAASLAAGLAAAGPGALAASLAAGFIDAVAGPGAAAGFLGAGLAGMGAGAAAHSKHPFQLGDMPQKQVYQSSSAHGDAHGVRSSSFHMSCLASSLLIYNWRWRLHSCCRPDVV